ncbi:hypothetical protein MMC07_007142 [Pseudocyphellaria aurata]|nr:hypothetical protein [Pseudocyphellaria aurata]
MRRCPGRGALRSFYRVAEARRIIIIVPIIGIPVQRWHRTSYDQETSHEKDDGQEEIESDISTTEEQAQIDGQERQGKDIADYAKDELRRSAQVERGNDSCNGCIASVPTGSPKAQSANPRHDTPRHEDLWLSTRPGKLWLRPIPRTTQPVS